MPSLFILYLNVSDRGSQHCDQLWFHLMEKNYFISLQDKAESPALLTAICDCLATMNPATYDKLEGSYQRTCLVVSHIRVCTLPYGMVPASTVIFIVATKVDYGIYIHNGIDRTEKQNTFGDEFSAFCCPAFFFTF